MTDQATLGEALAGHQAGRLPDAEHIYERNESDLATDAGGLVLWNKSVPDAHSDATGEHHVSIGQTGAVTP